MGKILLYLFMLIGLGYLLWGCPTKKYIPDPTPPEPQVQEEEQKPQSKRVEDTPGYLGREPYVGPRIQFRKMLA
ncbi:hypothetical protein QJS83_01170 [Bdellovibrio sp. 22V]|uniref:hypothetical protein n=1 Tax=Bdellovibrio TaxID=958 RepID=UPI0025434DC8|nr:hypothetical protein [Bdellovibrio sp. 22V]WII72478.1 hypothetical protein QJS83_01170 [Bdellovibrio sp. 22V]